MNGLASNKQARPEGYAKKMQKAQTQWGLHTMDGLDVGPDLVDELRDLL